MRLGHCSVWVFPNMVDQPSTSQLQLESMGTVQCLIHHMYGRVPQCPRHTSAHRSVHSINRVYGFVYDGVRQLCCTAQSPQLITPTITASGKCLAGPHGWNPHTRTSNSVQIRTLLIVYKKRVGSTQLTQCLVEGSHIYELSLMLSLSL